jgi:predicted amidophosphoribosyltransferase
VITCLGCWQPFDPIASRWLCPHCGLKASCCEGAAGLVQWVPAGWVPRPVPDPDVMAAARYMRERLAAGG